MPGCCRYGPARTAGGGVEGDRSASSRLLVTQRYQNLEISCGSRFYACWAGSAERGSGLRGAQMDRPVTSRVRVALNTLILLAGCLAGAAVAVATGQQALAGTVPPAPPGWTSVFTDDFAGPAGSPSSANWFYDIGMDRGNAEIEHNTSSTSNVYLDGKGHLVLKAINSGGSWTSARIESPRGGFQAPPRRGLGVTPPLEQPNPATGS